MADKAYLAVNVRIGFPEFRNRKAFAFKTVNSFTVNSSWKNLTDTAEFIVAKQLCFADQKRVFDLVKTGDPFYIEAGYNGNFNREFTGYISEVLDDLPVMFKGEDNMYVLKRTPVNKSYKSVSLKKLLTDIVPSQFKVNAPDGIELGTLFYSEKNNDNVASVLQELKDWGFYSFFKEDTLVCVKVHSKEDITVKYSYTKNMLPNNDLKYRRKDDIRVKVTLISKLNTGKELRVVVGDKDGVNQQLYITNNSDTNSLNTIANNALETFKIDGYQGSFESFGIPYVQHGYTATIKNTDNPDKEGNYYVDGLVVRLNDRGAFRRQIYLGRRAE